MRGLTTYLVAVLALGGGYALPTVAAPRKAAAKMANPDSPEALHAKFIAIKRSYRLGNISRATTWAQLAWIFERGSLLPKADRISLLETQAALLQEGGFPILAAIYAAQAIKLADDPLVSDLKPAWTVMRRVSEKQPIQNLVEVVAAAIPLHDKVAPVFGADWNYYAGNAAANHGDTAKALISYAALKPSDRYFIPAKYQQAMLLIDQEKIAEAEGVLKSILLTAPQVSPGLSESLRTKINDYTAMALGRIYYETKRFDAAVRMYRSVSKGGLNYYDALFEQGWAFFMGGYPMHALGAMYAVESPFYRDVYNPEAPMVRAMVHYFLCRYEDSRNALADFMERYDPDVKQLAEFLDRRRLDHEAAYSLFENLISGVSDRSLGMPRSILKTAAERDSMMHVRDQYAAILEERGRLLAKGPFGDRVNTARPMDYMDRWAQALRSDIGGRFLAELQEMKKDFDRLHAQAEFLYVELLMSEKDQLLGKELHASTKITHVSKKMQVNGWADKTQAWKDIRNGEYWWDEVGFYIAPVESMCTVAGPKSPAKP